MPHWKSALLVFMSAGIYLALMLVTINYAFGALPGFDLSKATFGRLAGSRIWSHSAHALGLLVAAILPALLLVVADRVAALRLAFWSGVVAAVAALVPSWLHPGVRPYLDASFYTVAAIDSAKTVLILMLLVWLISKLPSNYAMQRSSRVGTPLAGTGLVEDELGSASGAPTARRR